MVVTQPGFDELMAEFLKLEFSELFSLPEYIIRRKLGLESAYLDRGMQLREEWHDRFGIRGYSAHLIAPKLAIPRPGWHMWTLKAARQYWEERWELGGHLTADVLARRRLDFLGWKLGTNSGSIPDDLGILIRFAPLSSDVERFETPLVMAEITTPKPELPLMLKPEVSQDSGISWKLTDAEGVFVFSVGRPGERSFERAVIVAENQRTLTNGRIPAAALATWVYGF